MSRLVENEQQPTPLRLFIDPEGVASMRSFVADLQKSIVRLTQHLTSLPWSRERASSDKTYSVDQELEDVLFSTLSDLGTNCQGLIEANKYLDEGQSVSIRRFRGMHDGIELVSGQNPTGKLHERIVTPLLWSMFPQEVKNSNRTAAEIEIIEALRNNREVVISLTRGGGFGPRTR